MVVFVAGTDTGVGKTFVCGLLAAALTGRGLRVAAQKWVSTGVDRQPADLSFVSGLMGRKEIPGPGSDEAPCCFRFPASPHLAAEREGVVIDTERIKEATGRLAPRWDVLIVEGTGGVLVPLNRSLFLADLVASLHLPMLLVARSGLGTLNHVFLSIESARSRGIRILGVVLNTMGGEDPTIVADNARTIGEMGGVSVFGPIPRVEDPRDALPAVEEVAGFLIRSLQDGGSYSGR